MGTWELALPNTEEMKNRFKNEEIDDILLVLTYAGRTQPGQHKVIALMGNDGGTRATCPRPVRASLMPSRGVSPSRR